MDRRLSKKNCIRGNGFTPPFRDSQNSESSQVNVKDKNEDDSRQTPVSTDVSTAQVSSIIPPSTPGCNQQLVCFQLATPCEQECPSVSWTADSSAQPTMGTNPSSKLCTIKTLKGFRRPASRRTAIKKVSLSSRVLTSTKQAGNTEHTKEVDTGTREEVLSNQEGLCVFDLPPTQNTQTGVSCSDHKRTSTGKKITLEQSMVCREVLSIIATLHEEIKGIRAKYESALSRPYVKHSTVLMAPSFVPAQSHEE